MIDGPTLTPQHDMHTSIAITHSRLANLFDARLKESLIASTRSIAIALRIKPKRPACTADRHPPFASHLVDQLALSSRLQSFRLITSCSISLSSERSATIFFSRAFSASSSRIRRISDGSNPAYFFFQLKKVAWLIPAFRQISATGVPSSVCLMMNAFCASVNLDAFIVPIRPSPVESNRKTLAKTEGVLRERISEAWSSVPTLALTADAMSGDRERYIAMGMTDYLSKPIDQRELVSKMELVIAEHRASIPAASEGPELKSNSLVKRAAG
jgi:hypothetical protein